MQVSEQKVSILGVCIWLIAAFFFLYEFFLRTFVGSISHQLIVDLRLDISQFALLGSAYYLAYGLMQMPVGLLADKFGVKKILIFACLVCSVATFLFAHAHGFMQAFLGRLLMGFGSSFAFVCLLVIVVNWFPRRYFSFFAGASQFIGTMGPVLAGGPLISWLVHAHVDWRLALATIGGLGVLLALLVLAFVKSKPRGAGRNEMLFLSRSQPAWLLIKRLFKTPQAWVIACYSASVYVSIAVMAAVWGTNFLQAVGLSQAKSAYMMSIAWLAYAIGCPLMGFLSDICKRRKPFMVLCALLGVISMGLIVFGHFVSEFAYEGIFILLGLAATGQNIGFAIIAEQSGSQTKASALGLNNAFITLFSAILPLAVGWVIVWVGGSATAQGISLHAYSAGLALLPAVYVLSFILSVLFVRETFAKPQKELILLDR